MLSILYYERLHQHHSSQNHVPDSQGSRNSRRGSLVIAMLGVVLLVTGVGTTVRLQSISKEQHPSSVTSKVSVTVTNNRTVTVVATRRPTQIPTTLALINATTTTQLPTTPSPTAVPTDRPTPILPTTARPTLSPSMIPTVSSSCANISVHNTKRMRKRLHVGTYHMRWSGLVPTEEMALEQAILKRIEAVCGCTHHFPTLFQPYRNTTMISTYVGTPGWPRSHPPVGLHEEEAIKQVGTIIHCLYKSRVRHLDLSSAGDNKCKNMAVQHHTRTNTYTIALFDFDMAAMDDIFQSPRLQRLSNKVASNFTEYLSIQHHHMMTTCLGFQNYTKMESLAATASMVVEVD